MAEMKTKPTKASVQDFMRSIDHETRRKDGQTMLKMMRRITGWTPRMWGPTIVGFGSYHYKYASGHEGDYFVTGFSPRKTALTVYIMPGFSRYKDIMDKLGKYKTGKSCLYINKLDDIDLKLLERMITKSIKDMDRIYGVDDGKRMAP